ncbi:MAG: tetratricopeptide repeat protein [Planctomycetes bacterium]|nr:tetratricopeptide repeat protein [Planctomycetota bacterium]
MAQRKRKSRPRKRTQKPARPSKGAKALAIAASVAIIAAIGIVVYLVFFAGKHAATPGVSDKTFTPPKITRKAKSLNELLAMSPAQLADVDIAEMNLLCATGLPGAEKLDVCKAFSRLDDYARTVRYWTDQSMPEFHRNPDISENSQAKFRVLLLISVLRKEFGVHYNDRGQRNCDFSDSKNPFLHGLIDDTNGGTCASMPVMYVAVGRRLGYPMSIVLAKTHIFARWDDGDERFNIEGTGDRFNDYPDSHYRQWPHPISDTELKQGWYLKPLTPAEELAVFLQNRANCLIDNNRFREAKLAFTRSYQLAPQNPLGRQQIAYAAAGGRPVYGRRGRRVPISLLDDDFPTPSPRQRRNPILDVERINAINRANMQRMGLPPQPSTPGVPQTPSPYVPPRPYSPQLPHQPGRP